MFLKRRMFVPALAALLVLGACESDNQKQTIGMLGGAGLGGLLGSQFGSGKGNMVAIALGVLGGGFLGSEIGKRMDESDRVKASQTVSQALEKNPDGRRSIWQNPNNGHTGAVTPTRTSEFNGRPCREYEHMLTVGGETHRVVGMACRDPDGNWRAQAS
ncbi:MAG TPA: RT0821/Lpp0805 family surface protein [Candidatus Paceibacterota bacterium]